MLGRMRPSSLERLELEGPPSKIIKEDALSIYEVTLEKLRLGSRHALNSSSAKEMKISHSSESALSSSDDRSIKSSKE